MPTAREKNEMFAQKFWDAAAEWMNDPPEDVPDQLQELAQFMVITNHIPVWRELTLAQQQLFRHRAVPDLLPPNSLINAVKDVP